MRCASQKAGADSGRHHEASNANGKPLCPAAPAQLGSWALRGLVWRLGRHGSARGWLMAESWRQGWGEAGRSGSAWCCAPAGMPSSRRPRPRARTRWGIGAPESFVEASCAGREPREPWEPFRGSGSHPNFTCDPPTPRLPRGHLTALLELATGQQRTPKAATMGRPTVSAGPFPAACRCWSSESSIVVDRNMGRVDS